MFLIFIVKNPDIPSESEPFTGFFLSLSARAWRSKSVSKIIRKGKAEPLVKKRCKTRKRKTSVLLNLWMESSTHNNKINYHITDLSSQCHYDAKDVFKFKVVCDASKSCQPILRLIDNVSFAVKLVCTLESEANQGLMSRS